VTGRGTHRGRRVPAAGLALVGWAVAIASITGAAAEEPRASDTVGRRSGTADLTPAIRAMQADPFQNPGMLFVEEGRQRWRESIAGSRSCAACHGADGASMRGVATRYPAYDERLGRPVSLGERIVRHRQALTRAGGGDRPSLPGPDDPHRLALETFVASLSAGEPIADPADPRLAPFVARGEQRWQQRLGQLDLSCAQCHDERAGRRLAGAVIPQGHPTGYPIYRLEWQGLGSLQRRLRNCLTGVRAEPFAADSVEAVEIELYLRRRAAGLVLETPAIRP
jgi:sulfur-oxidizing protein SoxA